LAKHATLPVSYVSEYIYSLKQRRDHLHHKCSFIKWEKANVSLSATHSEESQKLIGSFLVSWDWFQLTAKTAVNFEPQRTWSSV